MRVLIECACPSFRPGAISECGQHGFSELVWLVGLAEQTVHLVGDKFRDATYPRCHHGRLGVRRLEQDNAEWLLAGWQNEAFSVAYPAPDLIVWQIHHHIYLVAKAKPVDDGGDSRSLWAFSADQNQS